MAATARGPRDSRAYGGERPYMRHLAADPGMGKYLRDLSEDVDRAFRYLEARTDFPNILFVDVSASSPTTTGGLLVAKGEELLQGQTFEAVTIGTGNAGLVFTALKPGKQGYSVAITDSGGATTISFTNNVLSIGINVDTTDADTTATAVNAASSAVHGIIRCDANSTGDGTGMPQVTAETAFATGEANDGYGDGFTAYVGGVEALPYHLTGDTSAAAISDTEVKLEMPDLSAASIGSEDPVSVRLVIDGTSTNVVVFTVEAASGLAPEIHWIDGGAAAAAGGDIVVYGANLLGGQTFDSLTTPDAAAAQVRFTAHKPGDTGYSVVLVHTGSLSVASFTAGLLTVNIDAGTTTAAQIATAVNANASPCNGYIRGDTPGAGSGTPAAMAEAALTGGTGSGWAFYCSGVECLPANEDSTEDSSAQVADDACTVTVPDLTGESPARAVGDIVSCHVVVDGVVSKVCLSCALA